MAVELRLLDAGDLSALLDLAVTEAQPLEVMPPVDGPPGWTQARVDAFTEFYRARFGGLDNALGTAAYVVVADGRVAGMIRMSRREQPRTLETGIWLGRAFRGRGVGRAALEALVLRAAEAGADTVIADTTPANAPALGTLRSLGAELVAEPGKVYATIPVRRAATAVDPAGDGPIETSE